MKFNSTIANIGFYSFLVLTIASFYVASIQPEDAEVIYHKWGVERVKKDSSKSTPCQNLDALDSVCEIMHWEIIDDTLRIYTQQDSIRDEIERIKYIRSLDPEGWE